ncbi:SIR2 family protein [Mesorhizobium sp. ESP7-2]|uniref:SIR2 family protein n=1 Tax=Mesorhizobium sp. ESP7-2 TaxID=2876622 RepID=UPI001CCEFDFE|nr:SIR2 family protein [Mesorhizobium sp. ESP7-2]MBZ9709307.1 SIR2 family protein [Mesorhizobium sp. ESP7-2]
MSELPTAPESEYQLIGPSEEGTVSDLLSGLSPKDGRQRLQALIAEWLRMENLVVLTGAGTSVSSGGKTMVELEKAVLAAVKAMAKCPATIKVIIDARTADKSTEKTGFEDWLSYLVNASYIGTATRSPFGGVIWKGEASPSVLELAWLVKEAGKVIFAECALSLPSTGAVSSTAIAPQLAFLAKLVARDSNLGRAHLFTLNYDTLFEQALELLGIQYFDGFTGRADARFDPSVYGLDIYYPGEIAEGRVRRFDKFLHFYKLHGSIHWQVRGDELRARHPDLSDYVKYATLDPVAKAKMIEELGDKIPSVGVLPTANKFAQTLSMPFAHLFRAFQIRMSAPQTFVLVLGYGFGDDHVTKIIETALMNPSLVLLVVEPNPNSPTIARIRGYKELGKRAFVLTASAPAFKKGAYQKSTFDDFARAIMPDVQWLDDFLRLRRFEKQIKASNGPDDQPANGSA